MLSRDERRLLAEIERRFELDDPGLARRLAKGPRGRRRLAAWGLPLLIALASVCELIGLVLLDATVVIVGLALFGVVLWRVHRANRHGHRRG